MFVLSQKKHLDKKMEVTVVLSQKKHLEENKMKEKRSKQPPKGSGRLLSCDLQHSSHGSALRSGNSLPGVND